MSLPFFYVTDLSAENILLNEDTSRHIIQVLRMKKGEHLLLTNGKGEKATAVIGSDHRKQCEVIIFSRQTEDEHLPRITIAISLIKNTARFEWFLEKATELGVNEILPLLCERTETEKFRFDRLQNILVSALLQSQQSRLPFLHPPALFQNIIGKADHPNKFIAHCLPQSKTALSVAAKEVQNSVIVFIGPEGDFTSSEVEAALQQRFQPVALGNTRLRTETAGIVASVLLRHLSKRQDG